MPYQSPASRYWPSIHDTATATRAMRQGALAAAINAVLTAALCGIGLYLGKAFLGFDAWGFLDAAFFAVAAWRIYRLSLPWSIAGLAVFITEKIFAMLNNPSTVSTGFVTLIFLLYYLHTVRAGFFLRKQKSAVTAAAVTTM